MEDYYEILGVTKSAEDIVIRAARSSLLQYYHPDKFKGNPTEALAKTTSINSAWDVLSDPEKRKTYDIKLREYYTVSKSNIESRNITSHKNTPPPSKKKPSFISKFIILSLLLFILFFGLKGLKVLYSNNEIYNLVIALNIYLRNFTIFSILLFIVFSPSSPKKDGRFKTGYKNNATAKPTPRILIALLLYSLCPYILSFGVLFLIKHSINNIGEISSIDSQKNKVVDFDKPNIKAKSFANSIIKNKTIESPAPTIETENETPLTSGSLTTINSENLNVDNIQSDINKKNEETPTPIESAQRLLSH